MNFRYKLLLILICIMLLLCGCTVKDETEERIDSKQIITINVWHQWSSNRDEFKKNFDLTIDEYMANNPNVEIIVHTLDTEAYKKKMHTDFAGDAKDVDVFFWWGGMNAKKFIENGKLLELDPYISDEMYGEVSKNAWKSFEYKGHIYACPSYAWYLTLFCNQRIFDRVGIELPETYDDLVSCIKAINQKEDLLPIALGAKDGWCAALGYQALTLRCVGAVNENIMFASSKGLGDSAGYYEAAVKFCELYRMGAFGDNPLDCDAGIAEEMFLNGNAAMYISGSWAANSIYSKACCEGMCEEFAPCKIPAIQGGTYSDDYIGGYVDAFWVNSKTEYQEEAAKLALFLNQEVGKKAYISGSGYTEWQIDGEYETDNLIAKKIYSFLEEGSHSVLAWDTILDSDKAKRSNELVQSLLGDDCSIENFIENMNKTIEGE